jgi:hypothetical protein
VDLNAPEPAANNEKPTQQEKKPDPATVATYFSANRSLIDAFMNSAILGAEATGAGTHTEVRAGEIASGVQGGTIPPEKIGEEAARGPFGKNAAEIETLTRDRRRGTIGDSNRGRRVRRVKVCRRSQKWTTVSCPEKCSDVYLYSPASRKPDRISDSRKCLEG